MVGMQGWMATTVIFFLFALVRLTKAALFAQINYRLKYPQQHQDTYFTKLTILLHSARL